MDPALLVEPGKAAPEAGDLEAAEAALRRAIALQPDDPAGYNNLGNLLRATHRPAEALEAYRRALFIAPHLGQVRGNLGTALLDLHRPQEAAVWLAQAVAADPMDAQARVNLGGALMRAAHPQAALAEYRRARRLAPDLPDAALGEALALLTLGDWQAGWDAYEARLGHPRFAFSLDDLPGRRWHGGDPLLGRTLLLFAEQGLGDTLQFCRYAPLLRARGARVLLQVPPPLVPLLQGLAEVVAAPGDKLPMFDAWCPLMSLPRECATTPRTVPAAPYLHADPQRLRAWSHRLGPKRGLRVGLAWAGNPAHPLDALRSLPQPALKPLLDLPGIEAHAMQPEARPADARICQHPEIADFADAAALVALMDVVVTVDTAAAHLAGALGCEVWILLAHAPDFRWMLDRTDTPWYASARLFRQKRPRGWCGVIDEVARALRDRTGHETPACRVREPVRP